MFKDKKFSNYKKTKLEDKIKSEEEKEAIIDPIKVQVKELLESKPLTLELINASSLPEEIKGKLTNCLNKTHGRSAFRGTLNSFFTTSYSDSR